MRASGRGRVVRGFRTRPGATLSPRALAPRRKRRAPPTPYAASAPACLLYAFPRPGEGCLFCSDHLLNISCLNDLVFITLRQAKRRYENE